MNRGFCKNDNKGFSLVELLIAVAIASIVGVAVFGFMKVGAKTFNYNSSDVSIQSESQLAFNQIQDLIIDTSVGVQYFAKSGAGFAEGTDLTKVSEDSEIGATDDKLLRLYNVEYIYDIWWDRDEDKLYYNEWSVIDPSSDIKEPNLSDSDAIKEALMSEYITDFSVDLSRLISSRVVRVDFTYEKSGRTQSSSHNITLRNQVVSGNKIEEKLKDAFTISSNVLPKEIRGKKIIYAEPDGRPIELTGVIDNAPGCTGLTGYHVYDDYAPAGNEIPTSGSNAKETLHYGFASSSDHISGLTTIGYNSGTLRIHPSDTGDANHEIKIKIYCQSNNAIAKIIIVRIVRNDSIDIEFRKSDTADDEDRDGKFRNDLIANETFELKPIPSIMWTSSKAHSEAAGDATLEPSSDDVTFIDGVVDKINKNLYLEGDIGYGLPAELFFETGNLKPGGNPCGTCGFQMSDSNKFTFETEKGTTPDGKKVIYRAPVKVKAYCGYSESKSINVTPGEWEGKAYRTESDFKISVNSDVKRGKPYVTPLMEDGAGILGSSSFTCKDPQPDDNPGGFWTNHCELVEVKVTQYDYDNLKADGKPTETTMNNASEYIRTTNNNGSEGSNWTWVCPYDWSPNCIYKFEFTVYIAHANGNDANKCFVLPRAGYSEANIEYKSDTVSKVFDRLRIKYSGNSHDNVQIKNIDYSEEIKKEAGVLYDDSKYVIYYARGWDNTDKKGRYYSYGTAELNNGTTSQYKTLNNDNNGNNSVILNMSYSDSFISDTDFANKYLCTHSNPWRLFEPVYSDDKISSWTECTNKYKSLEAPEGNQPRFANNKPSSTVLRLFKHQSNYVEVDMYKENWNTNGSIWTSSSMPARVRMYPRFIFDNNKYDKDIKDNYVECVLWNIKVPHHYKVFADLRRDLFRTLGVGEYDYCYFPGPGEPGFPGESDTDPLDNVWYYAGYGDKAGYNSTTYTANGIDGGKYYNLMYVLSEETPNYWKLKVYCDDETSAHAPKYIASYVYNDDEKLWVVQAD